MLWYLLTRVDAENERSLEPVAELIEMLVASNPAQRPSAAAVTKRLLRMEIDTLGQHFDPVTCRRAA
jgi:hypothetical protein